MPENKNSKSIKNQIIEIIRNRGHNVIKYSYYRCKIDKKFDVKILYSLRWNYDRTWYSGHTIRGFVNIYKNNSFILFAFDDAETVLIVPIEEVKKMISNNNFGVYHIFEKDGQYFTRQSQGGLNLTEYLNNYGQFV